MDSIPVRTWYLEMSQPPQDMPDELPFDMEITRLKNPTLSFYQYLYSQVGKGFSWFNRLLLFDDELTHIITHEKVEIHVLYLQGVPAGFAELDLRKENEIELAYFGILPEFRDQGLGKPFLNQILKIAWSLQPIRVWLHTCELDHKAAMNIYLEAGFRKYDERMELQQLGNKED
ncbi:MAG: GNAT family N-acetyltransferase [Bacteroidales bacterium]|nr:GNAT family N-acetyltransferase [Bacteroidales bacterium]MDZ4205314.1 GNAT family N-acetyltransferase [Bacteroidales bacterium]